MTTPEPPPYIPTPSAFVHGIDEDDTMHALRHRVEEWHLDAEPPERPDHRILVVGPARDGQLLEVVYVPAHTSYRVIHSMKLRPSTRATFL